MKRLLTLAALTFAVSVGVTQFTVAAAAAGDSQSQTRLLTGQVMDKSDAPLPDSVVYLKNTKSLAIKTFIADANGNYRFPALSPNVDYEVYAEYKGKKSDVKTLSGFDTRSKNQINLKIDLSK